MCAALARRPTAFDGVPFKKWRAAPHAFPPSSTLNPLPCFQMMPSFAPTFLKAPTAWSRSARVCAAEI
jgi:hypothetical protein